jgi:hypothetical protein
VCVSHDTEADKHRNVVERPFNALENLRGLATRHDTLGPQPLSSGNWSSRHSSLAPLC